MSPVNAPSSVKPPVVVTSQRTIGKRLTQPLHYETTLQRYQDRTLSPIHSIFVMLTETPLKAIGSAFTTLTLPLLGIKLFNSSDSSSDSFFKRWDFLALLGLGAVTSFGANSYLSSPSKAEDINTTPIIKGAETPENITNTLSSSQQALISDFFSSLFKLKELHKTTQIDDMMSLPKLPYLGIETKSKEELIQTFHQKGDFTRHNICQTFTENGKTKVIGLRIDLKAIKLALLEDPTHPFDIQFIVKDINDDDKRFEVYTSINKSIYQLREASLIAKEPTPITQKAKEAA